MSYRLTARIAEWIEAAIEKHGAGETFMWDVALAPSQQGAAVLIVVMTPGAVLNTVIHTTSVIGSPSSATEADIDGIIPQMIEAVRAERSRALAIGNGGPVEGLQTPSQGV